MLDKILGIRHAVALDEWSARVFRIRPPVITFEKKSWTPPALREDRDAVIVIGFSLRYLFAAVNTRVFSMAAISNPECARVAGARITRSTTIKW
jgi:hypothetical protein